VSAPRLEWTANGFGEWTATAGSLRVRVDEDGWWSVDGLKRSTPETQCASLVEAQLAAESACRSLLIEALVPFAPDPSTLPTRHLVGPFSNDRWTFDEAARTAPSHAEGWGLSLLAASRASRKDPP
jgi:hypothetical protein